MAFVTIKLLVVVERIYVIVILFFGAKNPWGFGFLEVVLGIFRNFY